jgi:hypothetical protein
MQCTGAFLHSTLLGLDHQFLFTRVCVTDNLTPCLSRTSFMQQGKGGAPGLRKCLSARNSGPDENAGDGTCQLWAKPQPAGAVALFVLNNLPPGVGAFPIAWIFIYISRDIYPLLRGRLLSHPRLIGPC